MAAVAALLESRTAVAALRRTLPRGGPGLVSCRGFANLRRLLESRLVDAVVLALTPALLPDLTELRRQLPGVPVVAYAPFRPDDGELLLACRKHAVPVAVEGVDDAVMGEMVIRGVRHRRAAPRVGRRTPNAPPHRAAPAVGVGCPVGRSGAALRTSELARRLDVSREHLSRQFGAGGAPNLKRVIDLTRIACAAQLLANPGYSIPTVVRLLHFASSSHLSGTARRIANVPTSGLGGLGPRGVLPAFARGNTRSRV